jgi:hypothetical protein
MRRNEKSWDEVRRAQMKWDKMRWDEMKCDVRSAKISVWSLDNKASLGVVLQHESLRVKTIDKNSATGLREARAHGPGCRPAHASSKDEKRNKMYNPKATSPPLCAGTTGKQCLYYGPPNLEIKQVLNHCFGSRVFSLRGNGVVGFPHQLISVVLIANSRRS